MQSSSALQPTQTFNYRVVRQFSIMTIVWGIVGMAVGALIAAQLIWPQLNFGVPWLTYGRLRPLHTNAVIFAFGGSALFATSYYIVQRTCQVRLWCDGLAKFTFWGYQSVIVMAALGYVLGVTQGKEYAEPEWYVDLWLTVVWVAYLLIFLMTLAKREEDKKKAEAAAAKAKELALAQISAKADVIFHAAGASGAGPARGAGGAWRWPPPPAGTSAPPRRPCR